VGELRGLRIRMKHNIYRVSMQFKLKIASLQLDAIKM